MQNLEAAIERVAARMNIDEIQVSLYDNIEDNKLSNPDSIVTKNGEIFIESRAGEFFKTKEQLDGFLATAFSKKELIESKHADIIENGVNYVMKEFPENENFLHLVENKLKISTNDQIAIKKGMMNNLFEYRMFIMEHYHALIKQSKNTYFKILGAGKKPSRQDRLKLSYINITSAPFAAVGTALSNNYKRQLDEMTRKMNNVIYPIFSKMFVKNTQIPIQEEFVKNNAIPIPFKESDVVRSCINLLQLYSSVLLVR